MKKGDVDVQRCSTRRLFSDAIKNQFPQAHERDQCYDFVPCTPLKACTGNNTCLVGYQHQQPNCLKKELDLDPGIDDLQRHHAMPRSLCWFTMQASN